jgi:hypothetical protein
MAADLGFYWDLLVNDRDGQLVLIAEVKNRTNASADWAAQFRRNIFAHGNVPKVPYFLIIFPDRFYLWVEVDDTPSYIQPTYTIDARPILQPYFERAGVEADQIGGQSLEIIAALWLGEIIHSEKPPEGVSEYQRWLIDSGLYTALSGGKFYYQAAA